jgi:hypothetical protein
MRYIYGGASHLGRLAQDQMRLFPRSFSCLSVVGDGVGFRCVRGVLLAWRPVRGGSWCGGLSHARASDRVDAFPLAGPRSTRIGFRCVRRVA